MKMRKERADVRGYVREAGVRLQAAGKLLLGRGHTQHIPPSISFNVSVSKKTATKVSSNWKNRVRPMKFLAFLSSAVQYVIQQRPAAVKRF